MSYSGISSGRASEPTLTQLRHRAVAEARRASVNFERVERVERDLDRESIAPALTLETGRRAAELRAAGLSWREVAAGIGLDPAGDRGRDRAMKAARRFGKGAGGPSLPAGEAASLGGRSSPAPVSRDPYGGRVPRAVDREDTGGGGDASVGA